MTKYGKILIWTGVIGLSIWGITKCCGCSKSDNPDDAESINLKSEAYIYSDIEETQKEEAPVKESPVKTKKSKKEQSESRPLNDDQQLEKALSNREFEKAREIAMRFSDEKGRYEYHSKREIQTNRVNKAQITWMISEGNLEDAETLSRELGCTDVFWEEISKNIRPLYESDFRSLYLLLCNYPFTASYHSQLKRYDVSYLPKAQNYAVNKDGSYYKQYYYSSNVGYNDEVAKFNNIVNKIINLAIFDEKASDLKKLVSLLKPEAVETSRKCVDDYNDYYDIYYKLENSAKQQALAQIKEAGIRI